MNPAMDETVYRQFLQEAEEWDARFSEMTGQVDESAADPCPQPIPCDPYAEEPYLNAWGLFTPGVLATIRDLHRNREWLEHEPRATSEVLVTLFPCFDAAGMTEQDILQRVSNALHNAGFSPSDQTSNPIWTFPV